MALIPYADVISDKLLAVDAQDVVTKAGIVVAGSLAGNLRPTSVTQEVGNTSYPSIRSYVDYEPLPIVHFYEDALHSTYDATFFDKIPEGPNPYLSSADIDFGQFQIGSSGLTNTTQAYDGDPESAAVGDNAASLALLSFTNPVGTTYQSLLYGFYLRYQADWKVDFQNDKYAETQLPMRLRIEHEKPSTIVPTNPNYTRLLATYAPPQSATPTTIVGVLPLSHYWATNSAGTLINKRDGISIDSALWETQVIVEAELDAFVTPASDFQIFEFFPLILNTTILDGVGLSAIRVPAQATPRQITVRGYVPISAQHTLQDWPGGDLVLNVTRQQHTTSETIIDFEQRGPTLGAPESEYETAVALRTRFARENSIASYPFRLSERG